MNDRINKILNIDPRSGDILQILNEDGEAINDKLIPELNADQLVQIYHWMVKIRISDKKACSLQRQGRMGTYASVEGQEACQVGCVWPQKKEDWLVPTFRENGMMWLKGVPLYQTYLYWMGNEKGSEFADDTNVLPVAIPVASHLPHATGLGWAERLKNGRGVAVCSFSDGATSEGDFHAALNFAGVMKARTLFFCQNNQYAISTPAYLQTASETFAEKAFAYGFRGIKIDGNDIFAVLAAVSEALELIRQNNEPVMIESYTYRIGPHTTSDNPKIYRDDEEVETWKKKDPILRLEKYLIKRGILNNQIITDIRSESTEEVNLEAKKALETPRPKLGDMFDYLLSDSYPMLDEQKTQLKKEYPAIK